MGAYAVQLSILPLALCGALLALAFLFRRVLWVRYALLTGAALCFLAGLFQGQA